MPDGPDPSLDVRRFDEGAVLFEEGSACDVLYVIQEGSVRLTKTVDGQQTTLAQLGGGDFLGEVSLVRHQAHSATATAIEPTSCLAVTGDALEQMLTGDAEIAIRFVTGLAERLASTRELLAMVGARDSRTRVCMALIRHAEMGGEQKGEGVWIRKRLGDIGSEVAVSDKEMGEVSKVLLRRQLLRVKRDGILVPDVSRLYEFVKESDV
ncbi:MAG: Crp/Fnr family transcriptional regulator [Deltaproteobacteria bacterium]|nr:Crp/Fnr family transcriptional regulator [Deltaproteobacteria bacterium]